MKYRHGGEERVYATGVYNEMSGDLQPRGIIIAAQRAAAAVGRPVLGAGDEGMNDPKREAIAAYLPAEAAQLAYWEASAALEDYLQTKGDTPPKRSSDGR